MGVDDAPPRHSLAPRSATRRWLPLGDSLDLSSRLVNRPWQGTGHRFHTAHRRGRLRSNNTGDIDPTLFIHTSGRTSPWRATLDHSVDPHPLSSLRVSSAGRHRRIATRGVGLRKREASGFGDVGRAGLLRCRPLRSSVPCRRAVDTAQESLLHRVVRHAASCVASRSVASSCASPPSICRGFSQGWSLHRVVAT